MLAVYLALTILVIVPGSFLLHADQAVVNLHFGGHHASWLPWVKVITGFGQRWIITDILQVVFVLACLRARSIRPMVYFVTALILINGSVGVVKTLIGRLGPFHQTDPHAIFVFGGNIYPSGHVSNAVSMFGVLAMAVPRYRRPLTVLAIAASLGVGFGTLFMRMHWFSDVLAGWVAGLLVLLTLPTLVPWVERFAEQIVVWGRDAVHQHPRLHRRAHAVLACAMRIVPADPDYWLTARERRRGVASHRARPGEHRARCRRLPPAVRIEPAAAQRPDPDSEFASWPAQDAAESPVSGDPAAGHDRQPAIR